MSDAKAKTHDLTCPLWGLSFLPTLMRTAKEYGYALTLHGSFARDFDFVAVPWTEDAKPASVLVEAVREAVGGHISNRDGDEKPHGRRGWSIHLGAGPYIDLSVMPLGRTP